jgi:transcriptional regulator with XRE-family HTH domain
MTPTDTAVTAHLKAALALRGKKQRDLAPILKCTQPTVSRRLNGKGKPLDLAELAVIADDLDVPLSSLFPDNRV